MKIESHIYWAIAIGAAVLLLSNGLVLYKNYATDWRTHQKAYLSKALEITQDEEIKTSITSRKPRIEQLVVRQFGEDRVDRCLTCHVSIDDERFRDEPQPFATHPAIPGDHSLREFGCTDCHDGNGRGLSEEDAHGYDKHWIKPLLTGDYTEVACAKCHPAPYLRETPYLQKGAGLFMTQACYGCHAITGISEGTLGVELTVVGSKWPLEYLEESLLDPKANNRESLMPTMALSEDEVKALVIYLKSLTGENLVAGPVTTLIAEKEWIARKAPEVDISYASGERLFTAKACNACHLINGSGGQIGPELSTVGRRRSQAWIIEHFRDPRALVAGSIMPNFRFSETELEALAEFLSQQTEKTE